MRKFLRQRKSSIRIAWSGLIYFFRTETHAFIHLMASIGVILLAVLFAVTPGEWLALIFAIGLVVQAEIWNTVMEKISDFIQPQLDPRIKVIKDLAASGVLWCVIIAVFIGVFIFGPYVLEWFGGG